ncbi:MAG: isocitrate/isopropylmalate family dehydrogenase, partial [Planctomycetota bacterium]|jgi:isocitrate dehydrogenase (NAD+)
VRALPGTRARFPGIDLVVIRETSEDIYSGLEHEVADGVYEAVKVTTRAACERVARFAYDYARAHGRKKVSIVHKANIMKRSDGLFLRTAQEIAEGYPEIETEDVIVDALCMRLVRDPLRFDVLLAGNLFGDIVSDLASGLGGGISASPSISIADGVRSFENPHGKVPELTGTGKASPIPMLVPAILMLEHLGEADAARRTWSALEGVLEDGLRTVDLGGEAGCAEVQRALIARLTA